MNKHVDALLTIGLWTLAAIGAFSIGSHIAAIKYWVSIAIK